MKQIVTVLFMLICCECFAQSFSNSLAKNCTLQFNARTASNQGFTTDTKHSWDGHIYVILSADMPWKPGRYTGTMSYYKDGMRNTEEKRINEKVKTFTFKITSKQYYQIMNYNKAFAKTKYVLATNDCITHVEGIAKILKLETPPRTKSLLPMEYLKRLDMVNSMDSLSERTKDIALK